MSNTFTTADALATFPNATLQSILGNPTMLTLLISMINVRKLQLQFLPAVGEATQMAQHDHSVGVYATYSNTPGLTPSIPFPTLFTLPLWVKMNATKQNGNKEPPLCCYQANVLGRH